MRSLFFFTAASISLFLSGCSSTPETTTMNTDTESVKDVHSYANPAEAVVTHLNWKATVDMENHTISAIATWDIKTAENAATILFDTRDLSIEKVWLNDDTTFTPYELATEDSVLGSALSVKIQPGTKKVSIAYTTSPAAEAVQWLAPSQTAGKKSPFVFTQSQAILARTWIPCQDSPGIRFTYDAEVTVPKQFLALMSAKNPQQRNETGIYTFSQPKAIPAYLMALAIGDIEFYSLGDRTGVYAEPATIKKAGYEFADMDKMLAAAEKLYGTYAWNRYDVLVLPPSFPFGGMENPEITFATPTILAGDRSLVSLIAHELAHSWSGNLVTNATWDDFWLNEGFTVYFERRIMEELEGADYAQMLAGLGCSDLEATIDEFNAQGLEKDTKLKLDLKGRNPDDGVSDIAYEKGYLLLTQVEAAVGRAKFDAFLKNYFHEFAFTGMTTEKFIAHIEEKLLPKGSEAAKKVNLEAWIFEPGLPGMFTCGTPARFTAVEKAAEEFLSGKATGGLNTKDWSSHEWQHFLRYLSPKLDAQKMAALDAAFHFTNTGNSEIAAVWFGATIQHHYQPAYAKLEAFLLEVGRRKFVKPLYEAMAKDPALKETAKAIYKKARPNYHAVTVGTMDKILLN
ncbi:MAG: M1 family metallopeptidase [Bacteroidota bacterium]